MRATSTPNCESRIQDELTFLRYVVSKGVTACGPIEPGVAVSKDKTTVVTVNVFAEGHPVKWIDFDWATTESKVKAQGNWLR